MKRGKFPCSDGWSPPEPRPPRSRWTCRLRAAVRDGVSLVPPLRARAAMARRCDRLAVQRVTAAAGQEPAFDHLRSAFPLDRSASPRSGESCHAGGPFAARRRNAGRPRNTARCADGSRETTSRHRAHARLSQHDRLEPCALSTTWRHGGLLAVPQRTTAWAKSPTHLTTSNRCEYCHTTRREAPALRPHGRDGRMARTATNRTTATGKSPTHLTDVDSCEDCHTTAAWSPARFDHRGVTARLLDVHNGTTAMGKSPTAPDGVDSREDWPHDRGRGVRALRSHGSRPAARCPQRHDPTGQSPTHLTTSNTCEDCHTTGGVGVPARLRHTGVTRSCATCHNGSTGDGYTERPLHQQYRLRRMPPHRASGRRRRSSTARPTTRAAIDRSLAARRVTSRTPKPRPGSRRPSSRTARDVHAADSSLVRTRRWMRRNGSTRWVSCATCTGACHVLHRRNAHADQATPQRRARRGEGRLLRARHLRNLRHLRRRR